MIASTPGVATVRCLWPRSRGQWSRLIREPLRRLPVRPGRRRPATPGTPRHRNRPGPPAGSPDCSIPPTPTPTPTPPPVGPGRHGRTHGPATPSARPVRTGSATPGRARRSRRRCRRRRDSNRRCRAGSRPATHTAHPCPIPVPSTDAYPPRSGSNCVPSRGSSAPQKVWRSPNTAAASRSSSDSNPLTTCTGTGAPAVGSMRSAATATPPTVGTTRPTAITISAATAPITTAVEAERETRPTPNTIADAHDGQSGTSHSAPSGGRVSDGRRRLAVHRHVLGLHRTHVPGAGPAVVTRVRVHRLPPGAGERQPDPVRASAASRRSSAGRRPPNRRNPTVGR